MINVVLKLLRIYSLLWLHKSILHLYVLLSYYSLLRLIKTFYIIYSFLVDTLLI